jgi:hypothetical protein
MEEDPVYARLVEFSGASTDNRDQIVQTVRETVIPMLREYDGYAGYVALFDGDKGRARAVLLWESKEAADSAEETLQERRRSISGSLGLTVESQDLYEAPVVELEAARV